MAYRLSRKIRNNNFFDRQWDSCLSPPLRPWSDKTGLSILGYAWIRFMTSLILSPWGPSNPILSDDLYRKSYKKADAHASVLYSLNTSMVLPVEPEFEQVLLYLIRALPVIWRFPPPHRLLKSWKLVWDFFWKVTRIIRRLLISYRYQSVFCNSVSSGKMIKVSLRSIAGTVFR